MTLRNPWALWGLALLVVPLLVHLLSRPRPRRLVFPSVRFLPPVRLASLTRRRLSDLPLLLIRTAAIGASVLALADPVIVTPWRRAAWEARLSRAVVLDMTGLETAADRTEAETRARELGDAADGSFLVRVARPPQQEPQAANDAAVEMAVGDAAAWLRASPPSRRELVVVSAFREGGWTPRALALGAGVGLRLEPVGAAPREHQYVLRVAVPPEGGPDVRERDVTVTGEGTRVGPGRGAPSDAGAALSLIAAPDEQWLVDAALDAVLADGAPVAAWPAPVTISWPGAPGRDAPNGALETPAEWMAPVVAAAGEVRARVRGGVLHLDTDRPASSAETPLLIRSVLRAVAPPDAAVEVRRRPRPELDAFERPASPPDASSYAAAEERDRRWLWAAALALLAVEALVRGRRRAATEVERPHQESAA